MEQMLADAEDAAAAVGDVVVVVKPSCEQVVAS